MNIDKELEALKRVEKNLEHHYPENIKDFNILKNALTELKTIKESKPSEAMECLNKIVESFNETSTGMYGLGEVVVANDLIYGFKEELETIKQALLKAQEDKQFIELILNKPQLINVFAFDGVHTWEEFEDTFSDEDKEYINTTKEEFEYMRNQLIKRGKING